MAAPEFSASSLLGYDARSDASAGEWDAARRRLYLLKDVPCPRSADAMVWERRETFDGNPVRLHAEGGDLDWVEPERTAAA